MCNICGNSYCVGNCLFTPNPSLQWGIVGNGQILMGAQAQCATQPITTTSLYDFLEIIADKTDTDASICFIDKLLKSRTLQLEELEKLKAKHQIDLDKSEKEFLDLCLKYRPSITSELIDKIKKLKAFF